MSRVRRLGAWLLFIGLIVLGVSRLLVPASPVRVDRSARGVVWAGALHIHSTLSDGSGTPAEVAAAAAAAGLDFVILTDHGDGTRDPSAAAYLSGVLVIDGVEISTRDGHYLAIGMRQAPYPLAGDADAVAEDVARLGGIGLIAHPDSSRPSLAWHADDVRGDGLEILNTDSAWRDESTSGLLARLVPYPWRPSAVLATTLTYPAGLLARLDDPDTRVPRLAVAGVDAHARIGLRPREEPSAVRRTLARWPSYEASFGTFGLVVPWPAGRAPSGNALDDAAVVVDALRTHSTTVALFALGDPAPLRFTALARGALHRPGVRLDSRQPVTLVVEAPPVPTASLRILRNGRPWREAPPGDRLVADVAADRAPAVYRAEAWLPQGWRQPALPWLISQGIAVDVPDVMPAMPPQDVPVLPAGVPVDGPWQVEHDPCSTMRVETDGPGVALMAMLCDDRQASPFAAARVDWPAGDTRWSRVTFVGSATQPMRLSVQVRVPTEGDGLRWARSVYLDATPRIVSLPLATFRPVPPAAGPPPVDRLHALLFVVDTVNTPPGARRGITVRDLQLQ